MSVAVDIPANEAGVVRVFALSRTKAEARAVRDDDTARTAALGASLDQTHVDVFPVADLAGVGLVQYLTDGHGVPPEALSADRAKLEQLDGWVMVVLSRAAGGTATRLRLDPHVTLIGTYDTTRTDWRAPAPLTSDAAAPYSAPVSGGRKRPSDAAMSGRIAMIALLVLGLLTWAMVWISG